MRNNIFTVYANKLHESIEIIIKHKIQVSWWSSYAGKTIETESGKIELYSPKVKSIKTLFIFCHELSHAYLIALKKNHPYKYQSEYAADEIGYLLIQGLGLKVPKKIFETNNFFILAYYRKEIIQGVDLKGKNITFSILYGDILKKLKKNPLPRLKNLLKTKDG